jgi:hypothetical protein
VDLSAAHRWITLPATTWITWAAITWITLPAIGWITLAGYPWISLGRLVTGITPQRLSLVQVRSAERSEEHSFV